MSKMKSLEEYMRNYFRSTPLENGPMSFSTFKSSSGSDPAGDYARAMTEATGKSMKTSSSYGTGAVSMERLGLSNTGYSDYLATLEKDNLAATQNALATERSAAEYNEAQNYLSYLSKYAEEQQALNTRITNALVRERITDSNTAYLYAIHNGLSPDMAKKAVSDSYGIIREKLISEILTRVASLELDGEGAEIYARHMGMNEEDSKMIGTQAKELYAHYVEMSDKYLEYLDRIEAQGDHTNGKYVTKYN